jgi:hypothetical protein
MKFSALVTPEQAEKLAALSKKIEDENAEASKENATLENIEGIDKILKELNGEVGENEED